MRIKVIILKIYQMQRKIKYHKTSVYSESHIRQSVDKDHM